MIDNKNANSSTRAAPKPKMAGNARQSMNFAKRSIGDDRASVSAMAAAFAKLKDRT